jgi:hypothetical protein
MQKIYLSALEFVQKRLFDMWVPAYYDPNLPEDMIATKPKPFEKTNRFRPVSKSRRDPSPFYKPYAPDQPQLSAFSIEGMVKMFYRKVEFELYKESDIVEIFDGLDRYLISLRQDVELGNERIIEYVRLCLELRKELYKHYYRYMELNPTAKEKLYPNNDPTKNIFHLMALAGGLREDHDALDPLRARSKPPYEVDTIKPVEDTSVDADTFIESSYGLSKEGPMIDDGKDFNFDDFLKR